MRCFRLPSDRVQQRRSGINFGDLVAASHITDRISGRLAAHFMRLARSWPSYHLLLEKLGESPPGVSACRMLAIPCA